MQSLSKLLNKLTGQKFLLLLIVTLVVGSTFAQDGQVKFGQNRVQYKKFKWQFYETDNFNVYFYQGGQDIGKYVIQSSEKVFEEVVEKLDFRLSNRLDIIVYNDISDLHQTNIGIKQDQDHVTGTTKILDNKLFVYFDGSHSNLDKQIKEGITRVYLNKIMVGSGFQEVIQNAILLNLPEWFTEGLIEYIGEPWTSSHENKLREYILSGEFNDLTKIEKKQQTFLGHSIWNYIATKYGEGSVPNLLYLVRVNKSLDRGFMFVTGKDLNGLLEEWYYLNLKKFKKQKSELEPFDEQDEVVLKTKKNFKYYEVNLNPQGTKIAYAENDIGRWRVKIYDIETEETKTLLRGGFRTNTLVTDQSAPMLAWSPSGSKLTVIYEKRDEFFITHFDKEEWKKEKPEPMRKFQKVYDFDYAGDDRNIVLSGMQKAQVDIFSYYLPSNRVTNHTNDFYDDLEPAYAEIDGRKGMLFVSNRPNDSLRVAKLDTILPNGTFDVYFFDFNNTLQPLAQLTQTPKANESFPQAFSDSTFTFLSDYTGVNSRYEGTIEQKRVFDKKQYFFTTNEEPEQIDSITLYPWVNLEDALAFGSTLKEVVKENNIPHYRLKGNAYRATNYYESLEAIQSTNKGKKIVEIAQHNKNQELYIKSKSELAYAGEALVITEPAIKTNPNTVTDTSSIEEPLAREREAIYQSKFDGWEKLPPSYQEQLLTEEQPDEETSSAYKLSRTRQYFLKFKTEEVSFGLDNSQLITPYQPFNPGNPIFNQPGFNALMRFGITDLFENHKIHGGFRFPTSFDGTEVYVTYENFKKRWDKSLTFYRKTSKESFGFQNPSVIVPVDSITNIRTNILETQLTYPFDVINSLRFKFGYRMDRSITKATDATSLDAANSSQNWLLSRVEFVHDHTVNKALNVKNGFRFNAFFEFQKEIPTKEDSIFSDIRIQVPEFNNSYLMLWGFDARYYQKVYKTIVWANRLAYSTSLGTKKMIYYLGGTDNMLFPGFNQNTPINTDNNYAYQSLAFHMRGFQQNVRNGNSYVVLNSELRIPIFSAFAKRPIKSALLENLQIIGFVDVGTAWEGASPFSNSNPLFQEVISNQGGTAIVRLQVQKQPVVIGFGTGIRANLLGYYFRGDIGWGYDTGTINKPRFQLSLGHDF